LDSELVKKLRKPFFYSPSSRKPDPCTRETTDAGFFSLF